MLTVNNIEVCYSEVILVLKGVSLDVPDGNIIALLGANGGGKTTMLKSISGLLKTEEGEVTDGSIEFEGERIDTAKWYVEGTDGKYKRWIGRAPSQFSAENVRVENGKLYITTKWDPDFDYSTKTKPEYKSPYEKYTTAAVLSNKTFLYGYMEIKCKAADAAITSSLSRLLM